MVRRRRTLARQNQMRQILEAPSRRRRAEFLAAVSSSRELHRGLVTPPRTVEAFERYLARLRGPAHIGYWIRTNENELAGVINLSEIVRGAFQSAYLGYYAFVPHDGHGRMSQGLRAGARGSVSSPSAASGRSKHTTWQCGFARIGSRTRVSTRRLFATIPQGWWSLARSRAVGAHSRGLAPTFPGWLTAVWSRRGRRSCATMSLRRTAQAAR
jgi:hypothetical protein